MKRALFMRWRGLALGAAVVALALGCTEDPPVAPESPFTGTWVLETVNGAPLPRVFAVLLDGSRRAVIGGEIIVRTRGRLDDTKRVIWERPSGARLEDAVDTLTAPFSSTPTQLYIRRYSLLANNDWVDTGTVSGESLQLRARLLEERFGTQRNVVLGYRRVR
ncbi:hypothetical protein [Gemmatimonas phototrophica]|uniref:Lipocalin-like domain-containing protein n=1 Tax=Gemmatimonas phototrophica TaxID=1379270 RepID=A0A143BFD8_9BACT|nr:hypothetical protein [Gemmatimonas phototrophica]AMW03729.1 hypothetical protein GEMMAAP_00455 [Gemmatimonas phototrophica]